MYQWRRKRVGVCMEWVGGEGNKVGREGYSRDVFF